MGNAIKDYLKTFTASLVRNNIPRGHKLSVACRGDCITNREGIKFVPHRQVRYNKGMGYCYKCDKGWVTTQRLCHCCHNKMRYKRRNKRVNLVKETLPS